MTEEQKQRARINSHKYYQKHREEIIARTSAYSKQRYHDDEEYRQRRYKASRKWITKHREKSKEYQAAYRKKHRPSKIQLQTRIDKAIEFIEGHIFHTGHLHTTKFNDVDIVILLDILRGEE